MGGRILRRKDMCSLSNWGSGVLILGSRSYVHPLTGENMTELYILYLNFLLGFVSFKTKMN